MRRWVLALLFLAVAAFASPVFAQNQPAYRNLDANGVDLTYGDSVLTFTEAVAGSGRGALALVRIGGGRTAFTTWDRLTFSRSATTTTESVVIGNGATWDRFTLGSGGYTPANGNGARLTGSAGNYTHTAADGTITEFANLNQTASISNFCTDQTPIGETCVLLPTSITSPDGRTVTLEWELHGVCTGPTIPQDCYYYYRLSQVANSHGYQVAFAYDDNSPTPNSAPPTVWFNRSGATLSNSVRSAVIGTVGYESVTGAVEVMDMAGRGWGIAGSIATLTAIRRPGASADSIAITYSGTTVSSATRDGVTTSYARSASSTTATMTVTDALNETTVITSDLTVGRPTQIVDPLSRTTGFQYDSFGRTTRVTRPLGDYTQFTYDDNSGVTRGNVVETRQVAQSGSSLPDIVSTASFDPSCANPVTCNRPNSTTDARGSVTTFTYDATHGGMLTATGPPPTTSATPPQVRTTYTQVNGEYLPETISACATGDASACVGTAAESRTVLTYDGNGNVETIERRDGTGALSATTALTYTAAGDVETVDGPLSGTADTTRYRYNAARQPIGVVGPDPDGGGTGQPHRARRITYNSNALPSAVDSGTVASQSDTDWAAMTVLESVTQRYDAVSRPDLRTLVANSTAFAALQTGYDGLGRVRCVAQRMNPAEFATPPTDACDLDTEGSFGPDRVTRTSYDAASQVTLVESAVGVTGVEADEVATTYTANGQVATVADANNNLTTYAYDGHDRLYRTYYPSPTTPGTSSTTDREQYDRDGNGNVTLHWLRDGNWIINTYDALDRLTYLNTPNLNWSDADTSYSYDLLGRLTSAEPDTGFDVTMVYDALGRRISETSYYGTKGFDYDLAGRLTRLTWNDGFYAAYDHLVTGEVTHVRENGATSGVGVLATYAYDNLGRRTSLTRGNGTSAGYSYDAASRLEELAETIPGTSSGQTIDFGYNPAAQITSRSTTNSAYAYTARINGVAADTINGLNQVTASGATSLTYDGRGNITGIGSTSYQYTSQNRMADANGALLAYDGLGRLAYAGYWPNGDRLDMAGHSLIAQVDSGNNVLRRYVHGPGVDEPIVWYEGSGTSDRRFLHADERGSIIAVSNSSGAVTNVNTYDEYGVPAAGNTGRFGYTGQHWIPSANAWYYRARFYHPALGRFMQTDPIGYGGGMNLYAYVGGDPINLSDPSGLYQDDQLVVVNGQLLCRGGFFFGAFCVMRDTFLGPRATSSGERNEASDNGSEQPDIVVTARRPQCLSVTPRRDIGNRGIAETAVRDPTGFVIAIDVYNLANEAADRRYSASDSRHGQFRHVYAAIRLTRLIGPSRARSFLDAGEVTGDNPMRDRIQDNYNNDLGIALASDPRNRSRSPDQLAQQALTRGCVR